MTTHRERIQACLAGDIPDQMPVALWRHFPVDDQSPETLAAAQIAFQRAYDFDLVKVTPASSFCIRDWGAEDEWRGNPEGTRQYTKHVVSQPQDWERLQVLDSTAPQLAGQLACLRQIRAGLARIRRCFKRSSIRWRRQKILPVKIHFWFICENILTL